MCSVDPYWFMISGPLYCQFICMHIYIYIYIYTYIYTYMYLYKIYTYIYIKREREKEGLDIVIIYVTKYVKSTSISWNEGFEHCGLTFHHG